MDHTDISALVILSESQLPQGLFGMCLAGLLHLLSLPFPIPCHHTSPSKTRWIGRPFSPTELWLQIQSAWEKRVLSRNSWHNSLGTMLSPGVLGWKGLAAALYTLWCFRPIVQVWHGYLWVCVVRQALLSAETTSAVPRSETWEGFKWLCHGNGSSGTS